MLARILLRDFLIQLESDLGWAEMPHKLLVQNLRDSNHTRGDNGDTFVQLIGHQVGYWPDFVLKRPIELLWGHVVVDNTHNSSCTARTEWARWLSMRRRFDLLTYFIRLCVCMLRSCCLML